MLICGAGGVGMAVTANTTIQLNVPDQLRGRVMSVYTTVFAGSVPFGGLVIGAIAPSWGVSPALVIGGVLCAGFGLLAIPWYRRIAGAQLGNRRVALAGAGGAAVAAADIGTIDPEGRSAGSITSGARPR